MMTGVSEMYIQGSEEGTLRFIYSAKPPKFLGERLDATVGLHNRA